MEEALDLELGSEVRSVSAMGGCGDLDGREWKDICDGERDGGNEEREVRRWCGSETWELLAPFEREA